MSDREKITWKWLPAAKARGERIPMLTAYDYPGAKLYDEAGIPVLLVGDSVGMVVLGYPDTTHVTMADMLHHVRAVARARTAALVVADLPYHAYETPEMALTNARALMNAGADAVKLEGGLARDAQVRAVIGAGIPVMGHLGMLPQSVREEGGYKIKGRTPEEQAGLMRDALALEKAGVFAIVLELVVHEFAAEISRALQVPTIGIGSGEDCDGQVLVSHDLLGLFPWFRPKFVKSTHELGAQAREIAAEYGRGVRAAK